MERPTKKETKKSEAINQVDVTSSSTPMVETCDQITPTQQGSGSSGLTIKEAYDKVYAAGDKVSELNRQFAFAGIAIIWVFKTGDGAAQLIPLSLIVPGFFLVLSLFLDLAHHLYKSEAPLKFIKAEERAGKSTVRFPTRIGKRADLLLYAKILPTVLAYIWLIIYLLMSFLLPPVPNINPPTANTSATTGHSQACCFRDPGRVSSRRHEFPAGRCARSQA